MGWRTETAIYVGFPYFFSPKSTSLLDWGKGGGDPVFKDEAWDVIKYTRMCAGCCRNGVVIHEKVEIPAVDISLFEMVITPIIFFGNVFFLVFAYRLEMLFFRYEIEGFCSMK